MKNILIDVIFSTGILIVGIIMGLNNSKADIQKIRNYEYNRGYTDYQIDTNIPAPFLSEETKVKKRNPRLIEKFKG